MEQDQAYRLKPVLYRGRDCQILLQNENGPCPLLAAANALLLQEKVKLPASAVRNNVASLSDLTNILANYVLQTSNFAAEESQFYFDELLRQIPKLQFGMDVNPKFTAGVMGYEYTEQLTCFDLWHVKLVHGWLLDPTTEENGAIFEAVGNKTYNELIEVVIMGREAEAKMPEIIQQLEELRAQHQSLESEPTPMDGSTDDLSAPAERIKPQQQPSGVLPSVDELVEKIAQLETQLEKLQMESSRATCIDHFLAATGHQLTQYGLASLHQELKDDELTVFFRNNHFATLTKHDGSLFLLVTDLGYANTPMVVWERLDVIDGDTEYVNSQFKAPGQITQSGSSLTPEQLLAQSSQNDADYHLALQLSGQPSDANINATSQCMLDTEEGKLMAAATEASLREFHGQQSSSEAGVTSSQLHNQQVTSMHSAPVAYTTTGGDRIEMGVPVSLSGMMLPNAQQSEHGQAAEATATFPHSTYATTQEAADALLAQQLAKELLQEEQQRQRDPDDDWRLARQMQDEEEQRAAVQRRAVQTNAAPTTPTNTTSATASGGTGRNQQHDSSSNRCIIS